MLLWILTATAAYDDVRAALAAGDDAGVVRAATPSVPVDAALAILVGDVLLRHGDAEGARQALAGAAATAGPLQGVAAWRAAEASWEAGFADEAASHAALGLSVWTTALGTALLLPWQARAAATLGDAPTAERAMAQCAQTRGCHIASEEVAVRLALALPDAAARAARLDALRPTLTTAGVVRLADEARADLAALGFPCPVWSPEQAWGLGRAAATEARFEEAWAIWRDAPAPDPTAWRTVGRLAGDAPAVLAALRTAPADDQEARWSTFHVAARAGLWNEAVAALDTLPPPSSRHPRDTVARQLAAGARWQAAAPLLETLVAGQGSAARWHQRLLALARAEEGLDAEAVAWLAPALHRTDPDGDAAHYWTWRWRPAEGGAHRDYLAEQRRLTWYGLLASGATSGRDGRWQGHRDELPTSVSAQDFGDNGRGWVRQPVVPTRPAGLPTLVLPEATPGLRDLALRVGVAEPMLPAIVALADVGHDLAGVLMQAVLDDVALRAPTWSADWPPGSRARDAAAVGDHRHGILPAEVALRELQDTPSRAPYLRDAFPIYRPALVWRAAAEADVDPWLALALLRAESAYDQGAISQADAHGPLQILPRTGARMAVWLGEPAFRIDDLHTPETATRYGLAYLGRLLDRFDGRWPLAVAAYNTGPRNVAAWLAEQPADAPLDRFVEAIPWAETRTYVQRVAAYYATYVALYAEGEAVTVPATVGTVDPRGVDF
ncbi:MAG: hypothetical protein RLZZ383_183 [Pseudomonadota bacterium]